MALELARALAATERDDNFHIARLLLLLSKHAGKRKTNRPMEGMTKLAKLDFLLRYPNCLERALLAIQVPPNEAEIAPFERTSIESKMIRFRYGPWDHRYRRWVAIMAARTLVDVAVEGKTVKIWLTEAGQCTADILVEDDAFGVLSKRAGLVARHFGRQSGSALKEFVYKTFPELEGMKWGEEISI